MNFLMDKVSSFLKTVLHRRGLAEHAEGALAAYRAKSWVLENLPQVSSYIHIRGVRDGEMTIACENAIAMQECSSIKEELLAELRRDSSCGAIRSIRVDRS